FLQTSLSGQGFAQIGRVLMALSDLVTVYLIFLLGRRLYGAWGGLLAAALAAFTVLQIQLAHFFAVDPVSTTFTLLALYGAICLYDRQSVGAAVLTGLAIALAVGSKFSALPIAFAPIIAAYLAIHHHRSTSSDQPDEAEPIETPKPGLNQVDRVRLQNRMIGLVMLALILAFIVFALTAPFVLLDFESFSRAVLDEQGNMVSGVADMPFTRQFRGTLAYWYFLEQQLRWGMGWPLGLLALGGVVWVIIKAIRGKAQPGEWIILWWLILYFGPTGLFLAKFMRYMIPIVPLFTLFGAGLVVALWRFKPRSLEDRGDSRWAGLMAGPGSNVAKVMAGALGTVALVGAAVWSLAFVNGVYGSDHTWVTFARWTYANVPDGSCIAYEHWDDRMPSDIPEPQGSAFAHNYVQPVLPMYDDDTQQKYELLRETLLKCDYIVLATNRLWRTIPRLPERYPMSTRYYEALFSGELGFEQVYAAKSPPTLGPFTFDDQPADESFTVYDHPKPILFKKVRQLSAAEWDALLGNTWQEAIPGYAGSPTLLMRLRGATSRPAPLAQETTTGEEKSLLLDGPVDQLPVVDDFRWNTAANQSTLLAIVTWWLLIMLLGVLAFPLAYLVFNKLPDRGYGLSKSFGILLVGYFVWLNSSLGGLANRLPTAIIAVVVMLGFSIWAAVRWRSQLIHFLKQQRGLIIISEAVFTLIYLFFIYLRIMNPDLWQPWLGGEKMLEIGFLNAILKSAHMPPYDPFFAGGIINYYYYGLFLVGVLIKLTGIQPSIAFNLAVPALAGLTGLNAFSLAGNLVTVRAPYGRLAPDNRQLMPETGPLEPLWPGSQPPRSGSGAAMARLLERSQSHTLRVVMAGLSAILFIVFIGNLEGAAQFLRELARLSVSNFQSAIPGVQTVVLAMGGLGHVMNGDSLAVYNYWDPTRVIPATINEFPFFSFLFADLHPHMIGIPFTILFLSLAYNWLRVDPLDPDQPVHRPEAVDDRPDNTAANGSSTEQQPVDEPAGTPMPSQQTVVDRESRFASAFKPYVDPARLPEQLRWLALPFVLGALGVINTWDLPTYLGLMVLAFMVSRYRRLAGPLTISRAGLLLLRGGLFAGVLLVVTYLMYAPFFANYQALDVGLGLVHTRTPLDQHLKIWGFFLFIIVTWLGISLLYPATRNSMLRTISLMLRRWNIWPHLSEIFRKLVKPEPESFQFGVWGIGLTLFITVALFLLGYRVPAYLFPLVMVALLLLFRREAGVETAYLGLLIFTGLLVLLGVEFFFLRDFLGGEYYRMNTLFKFFIQVWVMFGLAAAIALPHIWQWDWRWPLPLQIVWRVATLLLLLACLIYPVFGTRTRVDDRFPGAHNRPAIGTLDGLAYMTVGTFEWPAG
ncbi:MAG TPA: DUF2298 domain-containing protein, partial [Anaerolineae bacterium]